MCPDSRLGHATSRVAVYTARSRADYGQIRSWRYLVRPTVILQKTAALLRVILYERSAFT